MVLKVKQQQGRRTQAPFLILLIGVQTLCAAFFSEDALSQFRGFRW